MKRVMIFGGVVMAALCMIVPTVGKAMMTDKFSVSDMQEEKTLEEMEELADLQEEMDELCEKENLDENEYKDLSEEIIDQELECEVYNCQEEVELRISTVKTAIEDMKRDIERGVPDEVVADINNRINKLSPIVEKYEKIIGNEEIENTEYESISVQLEEDLSEVYEEIN